MAFKKICYGDWRKGLKRFGFCMLLLCCVLFPISAEDVDVEAGNTVRIQTSDTQIFCNRRVRVLEWNPLYRGFINTKRDVTLDSEGAGTFELPTGRYVFEILDKINDNTLLAVRSSTKAITANGENVIFLGCEGPLKLYLTYEDVTLSIKTIHIRSCAVDGFLSLKSKQGENCVNLLLSPDTDYRVAAHAELNSISALINEKINSASGSQIKVDNANKIQFKVRPGTPELDKAEIWFGFPEQWLSVTYSDEAILLTNRRQLLMNYILTFGNGKKAMLERRPYNLGRNNTIEIGGDLQPQGWAFLLYEETPNGWEPYLRYGLGVVDASGHVLDARRSTILFKKTFLTKDGQPLPKGRLDKSQKQAFSNPASAVSMNLEWWWGSPHTDTIKPEGLHEVSSTHYSISCPNTYRWQCANYLMMLERCFDICKVLTKRRGPATVNVDWRYSPGGAAKANIGNKVGGQRKLWMSLPFNGLQYCWSQFSEAANGGGNPYVIHENLHLFGYEHGQEMSKLEGQGEKIYPLLKWWLIDHPNFQLPYSLPK